MKINGIEVNPKITVSKLEKAVRRQMCTLSNPGYCIKCGRSQQGCEPDTREYTCNRCGTPTVYGAAELAMYLF